MEQQRLPAPPTPDLPIRFIGIDPGKDGAVGWMDVTGRDIGVELVPLVQVASVPRKRIDYDMVRMSDMLANLSRGHKTIVTMEDVTGFRGQSASRSFAFGVGFGLWKMALAVNGLWPCRFVQPRAWKLTMLGGVANSPDMEAEVLEQRLRGHPVCRTWWGKNGGLQDGKVDAVWLCEYARVNYRFAMGMR